MPSYVALMRHGKHLLWKACECFFVCLSSQELLKQSLFINHIRSLTDNCNSMHLWYSHTRKRSSNTCSLNVFILLLYCFFSRLLFTIINVIKFKRDYTAGKQSQKFSSEQYGDALYCVTSYRYNVCMSVTAFYKRSYVNMKLIHIDSYRKLN